MSWRRVSHLFVMAIVTAMACIVSIWMLLITAVAHISPPHPVVMQIGWKSGKEKSSICGNDEEEKFMYYAPHSGFSNQVIEFKNALVFAKLLNRTLIVPPVLDHHAAWLGSCPKGRVMSPHRLRNLVLTTILDLILSSRYISVTSLIDISTISPSRVRTIGLRRFLTLWCGIDIYKFSGGDICKTCPKNDSVQAALKTCIGLLNPLPVHAAQQQCYIYGVDDDCTSTIWRNLRVAPYHNKTRGRTELCNINSSIKCSHDSHGGAAWANLNPLQNVKRRHLLTDDAGERSSEWKLEKLGRKKVLDITTSLGRDSPTGAVPVLAFGSMFSTIYKGSHTYIDFQYPSGDADVDEFFQALKLLKFNPDIVVAARTYVQEVISKPFFCAQLRLLDGQFKNHRDRTLRNFEDRVLLLHHSSAGLRHPIPVFVMTDLLPENWTGTALGNIRDSKTLYHIHRLNSSEDVLESASRSILEGKFGFEVSAGSLLARETHEQPLTYLSSVIPLVLLCMEEVVCSCASLGFLGTEGSTITESIMDLRAAQICREVAPG